MNRIFVIGMIITLMFGAIHIGSNTVLAHEDNSTDDDHHHMHDGDFGDSWWGVTMVMMMFGGFLFFVLFIAFIFKGELFQKSHTTHTVISVLDERYARGELSRKEYLEMKADMRK